MYERKAREERFFDCHFFSLNQERCPKYPNLKLVPSIQISPKVKTAPKLKRTSSYIFPVKNSILGIWGIWSNQGRKVAIKESLCLAPLGAAPNLRLISPQTRKLFELFAFVADFIIVLAGKGSPEELSHFRQQCAGNTNLKINVDRSGSGINNRDQCK